MDGLPLDLVVAMSRLSPDQVAEVCRLIDQHETPETAYTSYELEEIERIRTLISEVQARK
jgi:hypothetical protein